MQTYILQTTDFSTTVTILAASEAQARGRLAQAMTEQAGLDPADLEVLQRHWLCTALSPASATRIAVQHGGGVVEILDVPVPAAQRAALYPHQFKIVGRQADSWSVSWHDTLQQAVAAGACYATATVYDPEDHPVAHLGSEQQAEVFGGR